MNTLLNQVDKINWIIIIALCATLGLAPFKPPHIVEKLSMLFNGTLVKPIDWFDLLLHSIPFILLLLKILAQFRKTKT